MSRAAAAPTLRLHEPRERPWSIRILGPLGGFRSGRITTQGDILGRLFAAAGHTVHTASSAPRPAFALAHIIRSALSSRTGDILLVQTYSGRSFAAAIGATLLARARRRPLILHLHGGGLADLFARRPRLARIALDGATAIVAPSSYLANAVRPLGHSAHVIANVLEIDACPFRERRVLRPRLLWMRSFHPLYNPNLALRTLARVHAVVPGATLVMAGADKGLAEMVRHEAERLGLADHVEFPGFLDRDGKIRETGRADIFINTNRVDNAPVSVLEACACGLPVVATRVAGIDALVEHERTALLVPDDDDQAMAAAVLRLLQDGDLANRLSRAGRALAERSSWTRIQSQWYSLFRHVSSGPAAHDVGSETHTVLLGRKRAGSGATRSRGGSAW